MTGLACGAGTLTGDALTLEIDIGLSCCQCEMAEICEFLGMRISSATAVAHKRPSGGLCALEVNDSFVPHPKMRQPQTACLSNEF